ncbi:hypothetical protein PS870_02039 [Pseudomonas fluorescens]|uniref:Uncharacterized protein n=1 Tax=Pseudomonas fluorescens TaxID=294 RepID=A0A5E7J8I1_PSEFL|nr:hypothetical protein PS870_02039 [Pseudomonas fluorescens]
MTGVDLASKIGCKKSPAETGLLVLSQTPPYVTSRQSPLGPCRYLCVYMAANPPYWVMLIVAVMQAPELPGMYLD